MSSGKGLFKQLALMQHFDEPYFFVEIDGEDVFFKGDEEEIRTTDFQAYLEANPEANFEDYCGEYLEVVEEYDEDSYENDYLVLTDAEADDKWDEELDNYIEECVLSEIPKRYQQYFDCESFKRDCEYDGRGHTLAHYDGCEYEEYVEYEGETFYIYRQN